MKLWIDSREKWTQPQSSDTHLSAYFDRHGIDWEVKKLDVGDYMLDGNDTISVDRKASIDELASNLLNREDKSRFMREVRRAKESGLHLVVLIESNKYHQIADLASWKSKYSGISGRSLMDAIYKTHIAYGVEFLFCPKISTGRRIIELLSCTDGKSVL